MLCLFFFNDTATTEIYTLSLHDALPISYGGALDAHRQGRQGDQGIHRQPGRFGLREEPPDRESDEDDQDRKSTRLNSSHANISYAVFCLKKKNITTTTILQPQIAH